MNRILALAVAAAVFIGVPSALSFAEPETETKRFYVSLDGSDSQDGSMEHPFATIARAQSRVREEIAGGLTGNVEVIIRAGVYTLDSPLELGPEDSGDGAYTVTYKGYENEFPTLSAGIAIEGFTQLPNGMWKTTVPQAETMMELYVNQSRAYRASIETKVYGLADYDDPETAYPYDGFYISKEVLNNIAHPEDLTIRQSKGWKGHAARVSGLVEDPMNPEQNIVLMNPWYSIFRSYAGQEGHGMHPSYGMRIENALEFLDNPGEFYFDQRTKELYYMPREGEDIQTAEVYAPRLRRVLEVSGKGGDLAKNIRFERLKFAHAAYETPEYNGYTHGQASGNFVAVRTDELNTPSGVDVTCADNIQFQNCVIYGMGGSGITLGHTVSNSSIIGCAVYDTGESGIVTGYTNGKYYQDSRTDMITRSTWSFSDVGSQPVFKIAESEGGWWTPDNDIKTGQKPWFRFDFDEPVTLSEIVVSANGTAGDMPEKKNFEIIASNDPDFSDYDVLHVQGDEAYSNARLTIPVTSSKTYQYLMIRKTKAYEAFSLDIVHLYTNDIPTERWEFPSNITLRDNFITRTGNAYYGSIGMCLYTTENLIAENNEISKNSYSAISAGWPGDGALSEGMKIRNNYIHDYMYEPCDGGGIYTLGVQNNAEISGNYIKNQMKPNAAVYTDLDSAGFYIHDNVFENVPNTYWTGLTGQRGITIENTYSTTDQSLVYTAEGGYDADTVYEAPELFAAGSPSPQAQAIIDSAGISSDNLWIKEMVPDGKAYYEDDPMGIYASYWAYSGDFDQTGDSMLSLARTIARSGEILLERGSFGEAPGQYSLETKEELEKSIAQLGDDTRVHDATFAGRTERLWHYFAAYDACVSSLNGSEPESSWYNWFGSRAEEKENSTVLPASLMPYLYQTPANDFSFSFCTPLSGGMNGIVFLFDCARQEYLTGGREDAYSHFELSVLKDAIALSYVERGVSHNLVSCSYAWDLTKQWHDVRILVHPYGDYKQVSVYVDGDEVLKQVALSYQPEPNGYFGILSPITDIEISDFSAVENTEQSTVTAYAAHYNENGQFVSAETAPVQPEGWKKTYPYGLAQYFPAGSYRTFAWDLTQRPLMQPWKYESEAENVALGKPVSLVPNTAFSNPEQAVDGDKTTQWISPAANVQMEIDLGQQFLIDEIKIYVPETTASEQTPFCVILANGETETNLGWQTPAAEGNVIPVCGQTSYRYVRILPAQGALLGLTEVEVLTGKLVPERNDAAKGKRVYLMGETSATMPGTELSNLLDGNPDTYWISQATYTELELDLGREYTIDEILLDVPQIVMDLENVNWPRDGRFNLLLYSDNYEKMLEAGWFTPKVGENRITADTNGEKYRYLRFRAFNGTIYGFNEIQVITSDRGYYDTNR